MIPCKEFVCKECGYNLKVDIFDNRSVNDILIDDFGWKFTNWEQKDQICHQCVSHKELKHRGVNFVVSPSGDWSVIYVNNIKVWEGDVWDGEAFNSIATALGSSYNEYEFTDEDEIDGFTPDHFSDIIGLKKI